MAWTQTDLSAIETAISKGNKSVRLGDRTIEYQSIKELLSARDAIKADLLAQKNTTQRPRMFRLRTGRGV